MDSASNTFKQDTLIYLNRRVRRLIATSQGGLGKAKRAINVIIRGVMLENKSKQQLCEFCGRVVKVDYDWEADADEEEDAKAGGDTEPRADPQVNVNRGKIPNHVCDKAKQAESARFIKSAKLSILKGTSNYKAWAAEVEDFLGREGIAYVLSPSALIDNALKQYDDWIARKIVYAHISAGRGDRLRRLTKRNRVASHLWLQLNLDVLHCPCNGLKETASDLGQELGKFQESAEDGCASCQYILDAVEAYSPGWVSDSNKRKCMVAKVSSYLVDVKLTGGHTLGRHFEFFAQPDIPKCLLTSGMTRPASSDSSTLIYLEIACTWLQNCIEGHPTCAVNDPSFMPSRLIDVGSEDQDPHLVDRKIEVAPYVTLSYCWGDIDSPLVTTRENINKHRERIPLAQFPLTLKDAVTVCRRMNVRYLWIDALCIVQNDVNEQDWYTECSMMRHIYSNALFSIAADVSRNSSEGFLRKEYDEPSWRMFSRTSDRGDEQTVFFRNASRFKHLDSDALLSSALSKRGWALQESILPNRILHFASGEIAWECNTHCQCQCRLSDYSLTKVQCCGILKARTQPSNHVYEEDHDKSKEIMHFLSSRTLESVYWAWQTIVEYYTQRQLTNHADKLSALSGLAQVAIDSHSFGAGAYLAGLWRGALVKGLLWHVRGTQQPRRYAEYRAPSWSWASLDGSVKYFAEHYQFAFEDKVVVSDAQCDTSPLDPTGRVKGGYIILRGRLVPVNVVVKSGRVSMYTGYSGHAGHTHEDQLAYVQAVGGGPSFEVLMDERMEYGDFSHGYYCLHVGNTLDLLRNGARVWWLVLKEQFLAEIDIPLPTTSALRTFERVGIGYKYFPIPGGEYGLFSGGSNAEATKAMKLKLL